MQYSDAIAYLARFTNYERELRYPYDGWSMNLERVRAVLGELGDPDRRLKIVHIAGSKGKGSTAAMIESMARAAGYKTGLYTSPHLLDFRERIRVGGEWVSEELAGEIVERMIPGIDRVHEQPKLGPLTYFELLTALAFAAFAHEGVELAVVEAGLGGRFDATNVCAPALTVLTPVSLDHTDILGDTLTKIAAEKSMIIKAGAPAVIGPQAAEVWQVYEARCNEVGAELIRSEDCYVWTRLDEGVEGQRLRVEGPRKLAEVFLPLVGDHQCVNLMTALAAGDALASSGFAIADQAMIGGLRSLRWPARFELISRRPDVILDGAHNAASAAYLRETVMRLYPGRPVVAVMGLGGDKDVEGFGRELGPLVDTAVLTRSQAMKAVSMERLRLSLGSHPSRIHETGGVAEALEWALDQAGPDELILITGSFYIISEALTWRRDHPGRFHL